MFHIFYWKMRKVKTKEEISKPYIPHTSYNLPQSSSHVHTNLISLLFQIILQTRKKKKDLPTLQLPLQILAHVKVKIPPGLYSWRFAIRFAKVIHLRDRIPLRDPIRLAVMPEPVKMSGRRLKISSRYWPVFRIFFGTECTAWYETYVSDRGRERSWTITRGPRPSFAAIDVG